MICPKHNYTHAANDRCPVAVWAKSAARKSRILAKRDQNEAISLCLDKPIEAGGPQTSNGRTTAPNRTMVKIERFGAKSIKRAKKSLPQRHGFDNIYTKPDWWIARMR